MSDVIIKILNGEKKFDREYIEKYVKENHSQDALTKKLIEVYKEAIKNLIINGNKKQHVISVFLVDFLY